jgi:hypothetical protein
MVASHIKKFVKQCFATGVSIDALSGSHNLDVKWFSKTYIAIFLWVVRVNLGKTFTFFFEFWKVYKTLLGELDDVLKLKGLCEFL